MSEIIKFPGKVVRTQEQIEKKQLFKVGDVVKFEKNAAAKYNLSAESEYIIDKITEDKLANLGLIGQHGEIYSRHFLVPVEEILFIREAK